MPAPKRSPTREARIINEIVVDAYTESERAMGWYYYLDNQPTGLWVILSEDVRGQILCRAPGG
jgi:hypothetical protein